MNSKKKKTQVIILDTSAILSGKPLDFENNKMITTVGVSNELKPGGKDFRNFEFLKNKGLVIESPEQKSRDIITKLSRETGDFDRLSKTDKDILALAYEYKINNYDIIIISDDYSIQNIANYLKIRYIGLNLKVITKRFKWICCCRGCGKKFKDNINICPICGAEIKKIISKKNDLNKM